MRRQAGEHLRDEGERRRQQASQGHHVQQSLRHLQLTGAPAGQRLLGEGWTSGDAPVGGGAWFVHVQEGGGLRD